MKIIVTLIVFLSVTGLTASVVEAGNCNMDPIVKRWLVERDTAATQILRLWSQGSPTDAFASNIAVILSNELYLFSQCREQPGFIKENVYVINGGTDPVVENVPAAILEHLAGTDILSPWRQFPKNEKKEDN